MLKVNKSQSQAVNEWDTAEAEGQEASAQQVSQGRQVWDGEVVRVQTPPPHQPNDEVSYIQ